MGLYEVDSILLLKSLECLITLWDITIFLLRAVQIPYQPVSSDFLQGVICNNNNNKTWLVLMKIKQERQIFIYTTLPFLVLAHSPQREENNKTKQKHTTNHKAQSKTKHLKRSFHGMYHILVFFQICVFLSPLNLVKISFISFMSVSGKFWRMIKNVLSCEVVDMPHGVWNRMMERGPGESSIISHGDALVFRRADGIFLLVSCSDW